MLWQQGNEKFLTAEFFYPNRLVVGLFVQDNELERVIQKIAQKIFIAAQFDGNCHVREFLRQKMAELFERHRRAAANGNRAAFPVKFADGGCHFALLIQNFLRESYGEPAVLVQRDSIF